MQRRKTTTSKQSINQYNKLKTKSSQVQSQQIQLKRINESNQKPLKAYPTQSNVIKPNQIESNKSTQPKTMNSIKQHKQIPSKAKLIQPNVISRIQPNPMWFVLLNDLLSACLIWLIWLVGLIGLKWWMSLPCLLGLVDWTGMIDCVDCLVWFDCLGYAWMASLGSLDLVALHWFASIGLD